MNNNTEVLLRQIWNILQNTSSGGSTANVDITGNSVGLATGSDISTLQTSLNSSLNSLLIQLNTINGNTDLIETLQTNTNNLLTLTNSYVDGVEGLLSALGSNTDNLETLLTALGLNTDDLETLLGIGNTLQTTANTSLNNIDFKLANVVSSLSNILTKLSDNTQTTRITDGTDTLAINPDGSINIQGSVTVPNNLVRESFPTSIEQNTSNIESNTQTIINNFNVNGFYINERDKATRCVGRKVTNSPSIGDVTYYIGHENNDFPINGSHNLQSNTYAISKIVLFADGGFEYFWSNGQRQSYNLIFDDGSQNYLTYTYS